MTEITVDEAQHAIACVNTLLPYERYVDMTLNNTEFNVVTETVYSHLEAHYKANRIRLAKAVINILNPSLRIM